MPKKTSARGFKTHYHLTGSWIIALIFLFTCACRNDKVDDKFEAVYKGQFPLSGLTIEYPGEGTIFPPEFPSPQFHWIDSLDSMAKWHIRLTTQNGEELYRETTKSEVWRPDSAIWQNIKAGSATGPVLFTIIGEHRTGFRSDWSSGRISFSFSTDSVGAPVFYRAVPLPFGYAIHHVDEIEWYSGRIDGGKPKKVLDNIPVCANCHSFSKAGLIAMDIDYANDKGSYIIVPSKDTVLLSFDKIITWSDYRRDAGDATYGLLSQVSPDSKYVLSTVKDRSVFVPVDNLEYSQLFFPIKGILVYYDSEEKKFHELPGASDPAYVQSNPNWSPDSREVMFTRAVRYTSSRIEMSDGVILDLESVKEFVSREQDFKFDLYRIPFNDGMGGKAVPVPGASLNDKSNYFARYSPDGNWVVFCQAENYMLLQPDSKLYIMPAGGGEPRLMNCNTGNMNSWHSWSPNGRWLVFSSKQRGPYTQLYLTHIDKDGNDSPPVFLENLAFESRAANIPEFLPVNASVLNKMVDEFSNHAMYFTRLAGTSKHDKKYLDALKYVEAALEADSTYLDAYIERISIRSILGNAGSTDDLRDRKIARALEDRMIRQNPGDKTLCVKRGHLRLKETDFNGAFQDAKQVLKLNPNDYEGFQLMANIYEEKGQFDMAIEYIRKVMELNPNITHQTHLALLYNKNNEPERAIEIMDGLIAGDQDIADLYISRGNLMLNKKDYPAARADFDRAVMAEPENYQTYRARSKYYWIASMPEMDKRDQDQAIALISEDIRKNPQNAPLLLSRAEIMAEMGDLQGAQREYENYMKSWPPVYTVLTELGQYYVAQKQWQNAINSYTKIIDNFPGRKKYLYDRSLAYEQTGDLQKALEDLNQVIAFYPKEYTCYYARAIVNSKLGNHEGFSRDIRTTSALLKEISQIRALNEKEQKILSSIHE